MLAPIRRQPNQPIPSRSTARLRLIRATAFLHLILGVGTGGYYFLGEGEWSLIDCLYMTVITMTTVGYAEVLPIGAVYGARLFTLVLIIIGMGFVLYFVSTLTAFFIDGSLGSLFLRRKMQKKLALMEGHYIVCGVGKTGIHVLEELVATGKEVVALDHSEDRIELLAQRYGETVPAVAGDATHDEDLVAVGIERAAGLVSCLGVEVRNLYCTLSARQLNSDMRIIVTSDNLKAEQKFIHAGADSVVYTSIISGRRIASEMIRPQVVTFLDLILRDKERAMRIEEVVIPDYSQVANKTLTQANVRRFGDVLVIAVRDVDNEHYSYNPGPNTVLHSGQVLIILGEVNCIDELRRFVSAP